MVIAVNTSISSYSLLSGRNVALQCQGCNTEDLGFSTFGWKPVTREGRMNKFGPSKQANGQCAFRGNHYIGLSDCYRVSRAGKLRHAKIQVAADYSDSRSASFNCHGELGYHPLEEISDSENAERGESRLSFAEIARSTVEANHKAILVHPGMINNEPYQETSFSELEYIIDDYGDIYFELNGDEKILQSPRARTPVNVFVGLDELQIYGEQERAAFENHNNIFIYNSSDANGKYDYEEDWNFIDYEGYDSDHSETPKDWAKLDTMLMIHPLHFAKKMVKAVSTNCSEKMDRPCNGVALIGLLRPALMEEESYLRRFLYGKEYSSGDDNCTGKNDEFSNENGEPKALSDKGEGKTQSENQSVFKLDDMLDSGYDDPTNSGLSADDPDLLSMIAPEAEESWTLGSESDSDSINSSIYKLEILSIQLISVYGNQSTVKVQDFQQAEPDILTHSSSEIIACFNSGSQKTKYALKALCQKKKGLDVEEASLVGVDSLGVDIRARCGAEVQTVRIAFKYQIIKYAQLCGAYCQSKPGVGRKKTRTCRTQSHELIHTHTIVMDNKILSAVSHLLSTKARYNNSIKLNVNLIFTITIRLLQKYDRCVEQFL